jgi:hypothetical protein
MEDPAAIAIPLILQKLARGAVFLRHQGPAAFMKETLYRASDVAAEKSLGVATAGCCTTAELDIDDPDARQYSTIWYAALYRLLRSLPIDVRDTDAGRYLHPFVLPPAFPANVLVVRSVSTNAPPPVQSTPQPAPSTMTLLAMRAEIAESGRRTSDAG